MSARRKKGLPTGALIALVAIAAVLCIVMVVVMYMDNHGMLGGEKIETEEAAETEETEDAQESMNKVITEDQTGGDHKILTGADIDEIEFPDFDSSLYMSDEAFKAVAPNHDNVDIEKLKKDTNPEIYAWLYIPQTEIDYPVLQHEDRVEDGYYSDHNMQGDPDPKGALFTQYFNKKEFKDFLTVIYGSNNSDGTMFSKLNLYRDPEFFKSNPYMYIYTGDKILVYQTFAAYEYDAVHLILYYCTNLDWMYVQYIDKLHEMPGIGSNVDESAWPNENDRLLTLSTHITGNEDKRFLVQAKLIGIKEL